MSSTYKVTGINLKSTPLGETDRLVTILTPEQGLLRVVAPGARKIHSPLAGRSALFVVNTLLVSRGRTLDRICQAETLLSHPGLSRQLLRLAAAQYLAEMVLHQSLSGQSQAELFLLFCQRLECLDQVPEAQVLPHLVGGIFALLTLAGLAPQVHTCVMTHQPLEPNPLDPQWHVGWSPSLGGVVKAGVLGGVATTRLAAADLRSLQQLPALDLPGTPAVWQRLEQVLRQYAEYHLERSIRSSELLHTCLT